MLTITDEEAAKEVSEAMREVFDRLGASLTVVKARCDPDESKAYSEKIGGLFYSFVFKVLEPLYVQHPKLMPEDWDDRPPMNPE